MRQIQRDIQLGIISASYGARGSIFKFDNFLAAVIEKKFKTNIPMYGITQARNEVSKGAEFEYVPPHTIHTEDRKDLGF